MLSVIILTKTITHSYRKQSLILGVTFGLVRHPRVRELVEGILKGGHEAFQIRRRKYGF